MTAPTLPPRYQLLAPLGSGGGGEVWAVKDRATGATVALKALAEGSDEHEAAALVREAVALSAIEGLGAPRVLRFGRLSDSGRAFMMRELVEGRSLAERIEAREPSRALLEAVAQAADQLTALHRARLLHGDIKPANIIVDESGRATLVDLGLSAALRDGGARPLGLTPRYAAPELLRGEPLSPRVEVFALGATLADVEAAADERLSSTEREELRALIARATAHDAAQRFPSVDELASALRRAARLDESRARASKAWALLGLDALASDLLDAIRGLRAHGGLLLVGPRQSGRTTLLRRIAWSLGLEGVSSAWIECAVVADAAEALAMELAAVNDLSASVVLIDDAALLDEQAMRLLEGARKAGARIVLAVDSEAPTLDLAEPTLALFSMRPLDTRHAVELVRASAPSLGDAVVSHILGRTGRWPGRLRTLLAGIELSPIVSAEDVDRVLHRTESPAASDVVAIHALLDRGHVEDAAIALTRYESDGSALIAVARSRMLVNRGDPSAAMRELDAVRETIASGQDGLLQAFFELHAARALLRSGDFDAAEACGRDAAERARSLPENGVSMASSIVSRRTIVPDALAVVGLCQSYRGHHEEAKRTLSDSVRLARETADQRLLSVTLGSLAVALQRNDELELSQATYLEALDAAEAAGDAGSVATMRLNLAGIAKRRGDLVTALRSLEAAVDMGRRSGRTATVRQALLNLANLDLELGRTARARGSIEALAHERDALGAHHATQLRGLEAEYAFRAGDVAAAERLCRECAESYVAIGRPMDAAEARVERVLYLASSVTADPAELTRELDEVAEGLAQSEAHRATLALARALVADLAGLHEEAAVGFEEALVVARRTGQHDREWRTLGARAATEERLGHPERAQRDREAALAVLEAVSSTLPLDLREVYWNDPTRRALREGFVRELGRTRTVLGAVPFAPRAGGTTTKRIAQDRLARLLEINRAIAGEHDLERLLERVTDHAIALLDAERGFVILRVDDGGDRPREILGGLMVRASREKAGGDVHAKFSRSIAEQVIETGEPFVTSSARDDARVADFMSVHREMLQSIGCAPIRSRSGAVIGALYVESRIKPVSSFEDELPTLLALADQVAIAIATARLVSENEARAADLARANAELEAARQKLEELLGHRTAQLVATRRDLKTTRAVLKSHFGYEGLVGTSDVMRRVYALVDRVKDNDVPVLVTGESGTGKEIVARAIHNAGKRSKKPFLAVNCGAIPENLLESELFGHVRGAFTGADRERKGLFREATEGTLLLDEIGEMPPKMQAGLLRVLQERVVRSVGGTREDPIDTRIVAATHRDLADLVRQGAFREDLYYRLHVIEVRIPPLRERVGDLPILIDHFLGIFASRYSRERRTVSRDALRRLAGYSWPGNVRQLENVLLNAWVLSDGHELEVDDFELPDGPNPSRRDRSESVPRIERLAGTIGEFKSDERTRILAALEQASWNRVKAAELVGLPRRTFYRRLKEYGIQ